MIPVIPSYNNNNISSHGFKYFIDNKYSMFHIDNCSPDSDEESISCISMKLLQKIYKIIFGKSGKKL